MTLCRQLQSRALEWFRDEVVAEVSGLYGAVGDQTCPGPFSLSDYLL